MKDYDLALNQLIAFCGQETFKSGLDRLRPIFAPFTSLAQQLVANNQLQIVTIAGTNGKGQCAFQLSDLLAKNEKEVFTWTSPHILSIEERVRHNLRPISTQDFLNGLEEIKKQKLSLSFYEACFWIFCFHSFLKIQDILQSNINSKITIVLEVGLGGRLDAVNLFDAQVVLIPSIGRDHKEYLGETTREILTEKWGVVRSESVVFSSLNQKYLRDFCQQKLLKSSLHIDIFDRGDVDENWCYQQRNLYLSLLAYFYLIDQRVDIDAQSLSFYQKNPPFMGPGRHEQMTRRGVSFIFIGAHNLDGHRAMIKQLASENQGYCEQSRPLYERVFISFSQRDNDEIYSCLKGFLDAPCISRSIVLSSFQDLHPRAASAVQLEAIYHDLKCTQAMTSGELRFDPEWSKNIFKDLPAHSKVLVTGSYYFIGEFQKALQMFE